MDRRKSSLEVSLIILNLECDPSEISTILGVQPDSVERLTDKSPSGKAKPYGTNAWEISSDLKNEFQLEEHIKALFRRVGDLERIRAIGGAWKTKIDCCLTLIGDDNSPILFLSDETVSLMSLFQSSLDIDFYCHP